MELSSTTNILNLQEHLLKWWMIKSLLSLMFLIYKIPTTETLHLMCLWKISKNWLSINYLSIIYQLSINTLKQNWKYLSLSGCLYLAYLTTQKIVGELISMSKTLSKHWEHNQWHISEKCLQVYKKLKHSRGTIITY